MRLKYRCIIAALLAFFVAPIDEIMLVTQVPILCPMMIGIATANGTAPDRHKACSIPIDADELCIIAVRMMALTTALMC